jgi:small subunit ribosomal protein S2
VIPGNDDSSRAIRLYARGVPMPCWKAQPVLQEIVAAGSDEFVEVRRRAEEQA